jgi:hypothetical protein
LDIVLFVIILSVLIIISVADYKIAGRLKVLSNERGNVEYFNMITKSYTITCILAIMLIIGAGVLLTLLKILLNKGIRKNHVKICTVVMVIPTFLLATVSYLFYINLDKIQTIYAGLCSVLALFVLGITERYYIEKQFSLIT